MRLKSLAMLVQMDLDQRGDCEVDPMTCNDLSLVFLTMRDPDRCTACNGRGWVNRFTHRIKVRCLKCGGRGKVAVATTPEFDPIALGC